MDANKYREGLNPEEQAAFDAAVQASATELAQAMRKKRTTRSTYDVNGLNVNIGDKGGICFYGWGKFPVHIYPQNLLHILDSGAELVNFLREHAGEVSWGRKFERGEGSPFETTDED